MTTQRTDETHQANTSDTKQEMAKYGITCVPVDYFHLADFRYTSLKDAVAQAKCQQ